MSKGISANVDGAFQQAKASYVNVNGDWIQFAGGSGNADFSNTETGTFSENGRTYKYVTFISNGTLTVTQPGFIEVFLVGGGGGGGRNSGGGGGGGCQVETGLLVEAGNHSIVVGSGGGKNSGTGGTSTFHGISAPGGGGGGANAGGGGHSWANDKVIIPGIRSNTVNWGGPGAGFASFPRHEGNAWGNGGPGTANYFTGTAITYSRGGNGIGSGGTGSSGAANSGNGGYGGGGNGRDGGYGGSGIVIVRTQIG